MNGVYGTDFFAFWNDPVFVRDISLGRFGRTEKSEPAGKPSDVLHRVLQAFRLIFPTS